MCIHEYIVYYIDMYILIRICTYVYSFCVNVYVDVCIYFQVDAVDASLLAESERSESDDKAADKTSKSQMYICNIFTYLNMCIVYCMYIYICVYCIVYIYVHMPGMYIHMI